MEDLLRDIICRLKSKTYKDCFLEHLPSWNFWQVVMVIKTYVDSRYAAASFYTRYSKLLSDQNQIALCRRMAKDMRKHGSSSRQTIDFSMRVPFRKLDLPFIMYSWLVGLGEPQLFSEQEVVRYWAPEKYGNRPQFGLIVHINCQNRRIISSCYEICNLRRTNFCGRTAINRSMVDLVYPFNVDKCDNRMLDEKSLKNKRIGLEIIGKFIKPEKDGELK